MGTTEVVEHILAHHGTKGMKWGVRNAGTAISNRRAARSASKVTVSDKGKRLKTSGGKGLPAHSDAVRVRTIGQKGKASGFKSLSDHELQSYTKRLNLEQQAKRLRFEDSSPPKKFVLKLLGQTGKTAVTSAANDVATQQVRKHLVKAAILAA